MRNITVSADEETHRLARIRAAELDTSVSALVRGYLRSLAATCALWAWRVCSVRRQRPVAAGRIPRHPTPRSVGG